MKINIKIIFPNQNVYNKTYKIDNEKDYLKIGRRFAHHIIYNVFIKENPNSSYSDFLDYCGECDVQIKKVFDFS